MSENRENRDNINSGFEGINFVRALHRLRVRASANGFNSGGVPFPV